MSLTGQFMIITKLKVGYLDRDASGDVRSHLYTNIITNFNHWFNNQFNISIYNSYKHHFKSHWSHEVLYIISQIFSFNFRSILLANECNDKCKAENNKCKSPTSSVSVTYDCDTEMIECIRACRAYLKHTWSILKLLNKLEL